MEIVELLREWYSSFEVKEEKWNEKYEGILIRIEGDGNYKRCRLAHKTASKMGDFTVFWQKDGNGKNIPFYEQDEVEDLIIVIKDGRWKGLFIIPKEVAVSKGILSSANSQGKMAMRFYPPWCSDLNRTALVTQRWQLNYFIDLSRNNEGVTT
ncbi:TPA: MepB family protein [Streptococcus agalactiae]|nr:MepB family protein [Streptococcus agalactiae]